MQKKNVRTECLLVLWYLTIASQMDKESKLFIQQLIRECEDVVSVTEDKRD